MRARGFGYPAAFNTSAGGVALGHPLADRLTFVFAPTMDGITRQRNRAAIWPGYPVNSADGTGYFVLSAGGADPTIRPGENGMEFWRDTTSASHYESWMAFTNSAKQGQLITSRSFTLSARVKFDSVASTRYIVAIGSFEVDGNGVDIVYLWWSSGGSLYFGHQTASDSYNDAIYAFTPAVGVWYRFTASFHQGMVRIFVNGSLVKVADDSATFSTRAQNRIRIGSTGSNAYGSPSTSAFEGSIVDAFIWDRPLGDAEVLNHHIHPYQMLGEAPLMVNALNPSLQSSFVQYLTLMGCGTR